MSAPAEPTATTASGSPATWFWVVAVVALVWNLMILMAFGMQVSMSDDALAALPEAQRALYANIPVWGTLAFAVEALAGAAGSLGLLLRKAWAVPAFVVSLLGVLVETARVVLTTNAVEVLGPGAVGMPVLTIAIGVALIVFARSAAARGWLS